MWRHTDKSDGPRRQAVVLVEEDKAGAAAVSAGLGQAFDPPAVIVGAGDAPSLSNPRYADIQTSGLPAVIIPARDKDNKQSGRRCSLHCLGQHGAVSGGTG